MNIVTLSPGIFVGLGFAVTIGAQLFVAYILKGPWRCPKDEELGRLRPEEIALLSGGPEGAIDTIVVSLVAREYLTIEECRLALRVVPPFDSPDAVRLVPFHERITALVRAKQRTSLLDVRALSAEASAVFGAKPIQSRYLLARGRLVLSRIAVAAPAACFGSIALSAAVGTTDGAGPFLVAFAVSLCLVFFGLRLSPISFTGEKGLTRLRMIHASLRSRGVRALSPDEVTIAFSLFGPDALPETMRNVSDCIKRFGSRISAPLGPGEVHVAPAPGPW